VSVILLEGFEKYGGPGLTSAELSVALTQGEWSSATSTSVMALATGLSSLGYALAMTNSTQTNITKSFATNYARLIGGFRFNCALASGTPGMILRDNATNQVSITIDAAFTISIRTGNVSGTAIQTSTGTVASGSTHYLEFDITIGAASPYSVWLDGSLILSGTGNTRGGGLNNYANTIVFGNVTVSSATISYDDIYLFDATGTTNNAALLTSPRVETSWAMSDNSVQFGFGAALLGATQRKGTSNFSVTSNMLYVRPFRPGLNCTLNSIEFQIGTSNAAISLRPVVYADSSGVPGTLLSAGSNVTGVTAGTNLVMSLTTPQSLVAGTQYWLGFMCDTSVTTIFQQADTSAAGRQATGVTFTSGAPSTAPTTTTGIATVLLWGNVSGTGVNWYEVTPSPTTNPVPVANRSYVTDTVVGHEDIFNIQPLVSAPTNAYAVAIKAFGARSDTGARTVSARLVSGGVDSGSTAVSPATTYVWIPSYFDRDPQGGGIAWTPGNINATTAGYRIDS
jgi:hypothetical protein